MSKRDEIRARRRKEHLRNQIIVVLLVIVGALLVTFALILPMINNGQKAANAASTPVAMITPEQFNTKVDGVHLGDPNAPVKVDIFGDFRCSACLYYSQTVEPTLIKDYVETGKVYYTFHSYIVIDGGDGTDASLRSANAAMCAAEQNRFWDFHATLYANQYTESAELFTDERLIKMAENLKLDMTAFNSCFQARKYSTQIQQDINEGIQLNVTGTPSVFINGKFVENFTQLPQEIDKVLAGQ
jgi:protein-disulfide isomerase